MEIASVDIELNRLAAIIQSSNDAIIGKDPSGIVQSWNKAAEKMFGHKAQEIIGKSIRMIIPPHLQHEEDLILAKVLKGERIDHCQTERLTKSGRSIMISLSVSPIMNKNNEVVGVSQIARDITFEKEICRDLERSNAVLEATFNQAAIGIVHANTKGAFIRMNEKFCKIVGYDESELLNKDFTCITHPDDIQTDLELVKSALKGETGNSTREKRFIHKSGQIIWANLTYSLVTDLSGPSFFVAFVEDITEKKKCLREIEDQVKSLALKDEFVSIAGHELRSPVFILKLQLQMLERSVAQMTKETFQGEKICLMIRKARDQVERFSELIDTILDATRIQHGRLTPKFAECSARECLLEALNLVETELRHSGNTINLCIEDDMKCLWDARQIERVFVNLLTNAGKYAPGTPIDIKMAKTTTGIRYELADHGPGISEKDLPTIFQKFNRLVSDQHTKGFGLGLYIVQQIIDSHGGVIRVDSKLGKGTKFIIDLPTFKKVSGDFLSEGQ